MCELFDHCVNSWNINIFFSKGVDEAMGSGISSVLEFQRVDNLGSYQNVPLFHERVTNSTLRFVVDKICSKLRNWDIRLLLEFGYFGTSGVTRNNRNLFGH